MYFIYFMVIGMDEEKQGITSKMMMMMMMMMMLMMVVMVAVRSQTLSLVAKTGNFKRNVYLCPSSPFLHDLIPSTLPAITIPSPSPSYTSHPFNTSSYHCILSLPNLSFTRTYQDNQMPSPPYLHPPPTSSRHGPIPSNPS